MNTRIEDFIVRHIADRRGLDTADIALDADLFEQGYIDSLGVFTMIMALEDEFSVRFGEDELVSPSINTVQGLVAVIASKAGENA